MAKKNNTKLKATTAMPIVTNSLASVIDNLSGFGNPFNAQSNLGNQLSQLDTQYLNLRYYLISNNRQLLSEMYVEHGIVQTLVDQPVSDAFRAGFDIKSSQLDGDDVEAILQWLEEKKAIHKLMEAMNWTRLFGGGGLFPIVAQDPATEFDIAKLNKHSQIEFRACDMWELYQFKNIDEHVQLEEGANPLVGEDYTYRGHKIHPSRVMRIDGKQAPSFVRPRLRGWGMSECEKIIRSLNQYMKNQNVIFELLDEAKVDVYHIEGLTDSLLTAAGSTQIAKRVQMANQIKNFVNALIMDKGDEYEQKQMTFTGLGEMLTQIRQGLAADLKMPMTKLFGISAAGFSSGEDDIENYNSMIEGEIRSKCKHHVVKLVQIASQIVLGFVPEDVSVHFKPLRILSAEEEETVKTQQFNRVMSYYQSGLAGNTEEVKEAINKGSLLPIEIDTKIGATEPIGGDFVTSTGEKKVDG